MAPSLYHPVKRRPFEPIYHFMMDKLASTLGNFDCHCSLFSDILLTIMKININCRPIVKVSIVSVLLIIEDNVWYPYELWRHSNRRHIVIVRWSPAKFVVIPLLGDTNRDVLGAVILYLSYKSLCMNKKKTNSSNKSTETNVPDLFKPHIGCHHLVLLILVNRQRQTELRLSTGFRPEESMSEILGGLSGQNQI